MKIKRILSVAATFVMALGLFTGCGAASTDTTTTTANNNTTAVQDTVKSTAASDSTTAQTTPSSGKKTLVVYYSGLRRAGLFSYVYNSDYCTKIGIFYVILQLMLTFAYH